MSNYRLYRRSGATFFTLRLSFTLNISWLQWRRSGDFYSFYFRICRRFLFSYHACIENVKTSYESFR